MGALFLPTGARTTDDAQQRALDRERYLSLYVALDQLHSTFDPASVVERIGDILEALLGASDFAVLTWAPDEDVPSIALTRGSGGDDPFDGPTYLGGSDAVDEVLRTGHPTTRSGYASTWAIPLVHLHTTVGAIAIRRFHAHKPILFEQDIELTRVLRYHGGSALVAAWYVTRGVQGS